jgi:spore maturation protein CgeB
MKVLLIRPGPAFSVLDVAMGWKRALEGLGCELADFNLDDRLSVYSMAHQQDDDGTWRRMFDAEAAVQLAANGIKAACWEFQPDVVLVVSAFFVPTMLLALMRARGSKVVLLHTESPYEDDRQLARAEYVDLNLLNDPTNLERFEQVAPSYYQPHCFDPKMHHPRPARAEHRSDFCFVGTGYRSRMEFLEAVDFSGIDVALAGHWQWTEEYSPLRKFLAHDVDVCCDNEETQLLYAGTKASANLYRRDAERPELERGWAMGPREVELAASRTFFLREPRGESDDVLRMLPTFEGPEDFGAQLRWWLARDEAREEAARHAREAIVDRTFENAARRLLTRLAA